MLSTTPVHRAGLLSTLIANGALHAAHLASMQTPAGALILSGCVFRCLAMPFTIYGDQCLHRVACALPELHDAHKEYLDIVDHPRAIAWEKRVAAQKLKNDRDRIFRSFRTNNVKMTAPYAVGSALSLYCLGVPAQQIGTFFVQDAGMAIVSPLAVSCMAGGQLSLASTATTSAATLFTVDPTLALAAGLTCFNVLRHLSQRVGFNDRLDGWIKKTKQAVCLGLGLVAASSLLAGPLTYALALPALHFFPPYLAPVWFGMSATTALKTILVNGTAPGQAMFRLPSYPPQHGTYGGESTAAGHEYRLAFTGVDVEETRSVWQTQKRILDYECDVRLHRFLKQIGLFSDVDELEYEADKLKRKRAVARERRLAHTVANEDVSSKTQAPIRRRTMHDSSGEAPQEADEYSSTSSREMVAVQMEHAQLEELRGRQARKAAREAAWKQRH
ncbi:conserved hypothetical protein [Leishmania infantum JPCM5]|uniref:Uncharacterized protein n=2 Tax=Leishmania infantum TaxID=5671 RepID=A4HXF0_LEIIN|nr:conserved hypothetical protein [Leishmania infantum JPCM5]CAC9478129.1 hypothetical_protein_-_conserved [Leishmania infantum]CAM59769.1 conserved hypothetical protein [Leishmania infantum JPCM5]SUZ40844.1 hypothetical_protein_-_conserved [Leishmania infantum]|eukprot:XP_001464741.1 conserved hypothetical protein [Leishmania infantum JPCM5]